MARCLRPGAQSRKWRTSSGLATTGSLRGSLGIGNGLLDVPTPLEGDLVEEAQGRDRDRDRAGRHLLGVGEEQLVVADLLGSQRRWRLAEMAGEQRHLLEVGVLCARRKMAHLHVLGHAETEWCHGKAPLRDRMEWAAGSRVHGLATGADRQEKRKIEDGWEREESNYGRCIALSEGSPMPRSRLVQCPLCYSNYLPPSPDRPAFGPSPFIPAYLTMTPTPGPLPLDRSLHA